MAKSKYAPRLGKDKWGQVRWSHRCLARVNGRQCRCMTYDGWEHCSRHWKQRIAYLTEKTPATIEEVLRWIEGSATIDTGFDCAEANPAEKSVTFTDFTGTRFVFQLSKVVKAKPWKQRVAERIAERSGEKWEAA